MKGDLEGLFNVRGVIPKFVEYKDTERSRSGLSSRLRLLSDVEVRSMTDYLKL